MNNDKCLIIAEVGVNHNGDINLAKKLCEEAKNAGADVVKFQTWITEDIITKNAKKANYQIKNTNNNETQFEMLKKLELPFSAFEEIKKYCDEIGIMFASTANDRKTIDFVLGLGEPFIKIGSSDVCNIPFLRYCGSKNMPIIMSTGMSTIDEIRTSIDVLCSSGCKDIKILHCTTNYPCSFNEVNLRSMQTLKKLFGYEVGYSDHTIGIEVPICAVALGAKVIEKHFTLDKKMDGPDHIASTEPEEFKRMVESIRNIEMALGSYEKKPTSSELEISKFVKRKIVASKTINKGDIFNETNICVRRSENGLSVKYWDNLIGKKAENNYFIGEEINEKEI